MANNENDFETDSADIDFNDSVDFDEFDANSSKTTLGSAWNSSPVVKFGLVGVAILVVIAAIALFGGEDKKVASSSVRGGATTLKEAPGVNEVTPSMREALEETNEQRYEDALKQGVSSISTPIDPPKVLLGIPENEAAGEDPLVRWKRLQEERLRLQRQQEQMVVQAQVDPKRAEKVNGLREAMANQLSEVLSKSGSVPVMENMIVFSKAQQEQERTLAQQSILQTGGVVSQGAVSPDVREKLKVIIPAGEIEYAQLLVEANSDIQGPIVGMIVSGPFNGARVLGSFQKQEEYLTMQFTTLVGKDGQSIPISATAVDPATTLTGMATDVDHRYWKRVILPAAASFIEGIGKAIADNGKTTVSVTGETVTEETDDLNSKEELSKAASEAASKVGDLLDDEAGETEILVRVRAGTPFGLLFTAPVTEQAVSSSQYVPEVKAENSSNGLNFFGQQPNAQGQNLNSMQLLQQGLGSQMYLQQQANPYAPAPQLNYDNGLSPQ